MATTNGLYCGLERIEDCRRALSWNFNLGASQWAIELHVSCRLGHNVKEGNLRQWPRSEVKLCDILHVAQAPQATGGTNSGKRAAVLHSLIRRADSIALTKKEKRQSIVCVCALDKEPGGKKDCEDHSGLEFTGPREKTDRTGVMDGWVMHCGMLILIVDSCWLRNVRPPGASGGPGRDIGGGSAGCRRSRGGTEGAGGAGGAGRRGRRRGSSPVRVRGTRVVDKARDPQQPGLASAAVV